MRTNVIAIAGLLIALLVPRGPARAQVPADSAARARITHVLRTRDGSTLLGRLVSDSADTVRFETSGGILAIPRSAILELKPVEAKTVQANGEYWFPDPNRTRLFFAPTGRTLEKGEGYYSNTYLFLQNFAGGLTDRITVGGGFSIFPTGSLDAQVYYLTPKVNVLSTEKDNLALGALAAWVPYDDGTSFGILYGVGTHGGPDGSVSAGAGWGYSGSNMSSRPAVMLGGSKRVSRRVALVTENYGMWYNDDLYTCDAVGCSTTSRKRLGALAMYGVRFMGEKLSVDFALFNLETNDASWIFPGIPYISFAVKF